MNSLFDLNGRFQYWAAFRRSTFREWVDNNQTYTFPDIMNMLESMQNCLIQINGTVNVPSE